ncbi:DUF6907 domain-containing protein [Kitasatospora cineracea]|uniref:Uncharacterized protein n=1 Tax=Kitasatospora cineracea TaxID=88074 RepID=A0A3N4RPN4_9ACTN|nr:hypothetical protein [Kitasatospora cineracea]RPE34766.1 hypothetical protein EDD38_3102 [Kitasatospora cineracea]
MSASRQVTVHTSDCGPVTISCPAWCAGRHQTGEQLVDLGHASNDIELLVETERGRVELLHLLFGSYPFSTRPADRGLVVAVHLGGDYFDFHDDAALYRLADEVAAHAIRIRAVARQLAELQRAEGGR